MSLMLVLIILVAAFNILSSLVMVVLDKQGEVAILRTMGMQSQNCHEDFHCAGIWAVCSVVCLRSVIGGGVLTPSEPGAACVRVNLYMDAGGGGLPVELQISQVLLIALGRIINGFMATLYPAYRAAHIRPAERYVMSNILLRCPGSGKTYREGELKHPVLTADSLTV